MNQQLFLSHISPFKDKMFRLAKRLLISKDEAEDTTQEIYLKLWNQHYKLDEIKNLEAYVMTLTKNLCFDKLKAKSSENISLTNLKTDTKSNNSLQNKIELQDMVALVKNRIDRLPEQQRLVMQLRDIEQYSFDEIETITGIKSATVRVLLSRARKNIREQLFPSGNFKNNI